ncbi:hypothetical protein GCM10011499_38080 [Pelagibacterium lentulum]|uniref:Uncharacterized protein n=1 Tax=Pelagibacterium lentulum TaxID=2029865 RepID=A0A916RPL5_9HYPH|nr:hypothetical protein GCM10011499_38080 [Pelagibacterium lentulum]
MLMSDPKKIATPSGRPREAARKCASETRPATVRDGAKAQSAGNRTPAARASVYPLHPIEPVKMPPAMKATETATLRRESENFPGEAKNALGRDGSEISRVIGTNKI